ncbi:MAG: hypothetical protein O7F16_00645 [Acidobacteria bacterium]|nr:hypothetical protein [Acidobacteriota bacterium]
MWLDREQAVLRRRPLRRQYPLVNRERSIGVDPATSIADRQPQGGPDPGTLAGGAEEVLAGVPACNLAGGAPQGYD